MKELRELIYKAIGEASVCWSELPKGVFDDLKAKKIADNLIATLERDNLELKFKDDAKYLWVMQSESGFDYLSDSFFPKCKEIHPKFLYPVAKLNEQTKKVEWL